jgi:hypothetical protein
MMKELGLLHPDFLHDLTLQKATHQDQHSGDIQMLEMFRFNVTTEPKKVMFGPLQGPMDKRKMSRVVKRVCLKMKMSKRTQWSVATSVWESAMKRVKNPPEVTKPLQSSNKRGHKAQQT